MLHLDCNIFFQQIQKKWEEPGKCQVKQHETFISTHPGEDRDSDSEDEISPQQQLPVPIQEEVIEPIKQTNDVEMQEEDEEEGNKNSATDTAEVVNDE